jgi:hypothetical protein
MEIHMIEILVAAGLLIVGQGGVLHLSLRKYINGMGDTVDEIKKDTRSIIDNQHNMDVRLAVVEKDVDILKTRIQ